MWGAPQDAPLDRTELGANIRPADIDAIFAPFAGSDSPGCQLGVLYRGEFVYKKAYGMADLERRVPLTTSASKKSASVGVGGSWCIVRKVIRISDRNAPSKNKDLRRNQIGSSATVGGLGRFPMVGRARWHCFR
jgi:hypothetical protein